jgi:hypothetical protein
MGAPTNNRPDCFWQADLDEAAEALVDVLEEVRPQILVTYDALRAHATRSASTRGGSPSPKPVARNVSAVERYVLRDASKGVRETDSSGDLGGRPCIDTGLRLQA